MALRQQNDKEPNDAHEAMKGLALKTFRGQQHHEIAIVE
jgi:hypothetical protein